MAWLAGRGGGVVVGVRHPAHDNSGVLTASFLPESTGPYLVVLIIGFVIGAYGHLAKLRWLVVFGILLILAATVMFQIALRTLPNPPGF